MTPAEIMIGDGSETPVATSQLHHQKKLHQHLQQQQKQLLQLHLQPIV
jgi:hypothetical protein